MSLTWRPDEEWVPPRPGGLGMLLATLRGGVLLLVLAVGLAATGALRLAEVVLRRKRWTTPRVTVAVCRIALWVIGLRAKVDGRPMSKPGVLLANHSSSLDILVLNAQGPLVFVAKSEVAGWPGIGMLARATGTVFVRREARTEAPAQGRRLAERLADGERLALFPEGTSTDGLRVLPFRSALLAGLLGQDVPAGVAVQPVTLRYDAPPGHDPRFYAWFGDADLGPHLLLVLAQRTQGTVRVTFHPPIPVSGRHRKSLAAEAEAAVRSAL